MMNLKELSTDRVQKRIFSYRLNSQYDFNTIVKLLSFCHRTTYLNIQGEPIYLHCQRAGGSGDVTAMHSANLPTNAGKEPISSSTEATRLSINRRSYDVSYWTQTKYSIHLYISSINRERNYKLQVWNKLRKFQESEAKIAHECEIISII